MTKQSNEPYVDPDGMYRIDPAGNMKRGGDLDINDFMFMLYGYTDHIAPENRIPSPGWVPPAPISI